LEVNLHILPCLHTFLRILWPGDVGTCITPGNNRPKLLGYRR